MMSDAAANQAELSKAEAEKSEPIDTDYQEANGEEAYEEEVYEETLSEAELNAMLEQLCESKAAEFKLIGYENVSGQDVWECVSDKYHKTGMPPLYVVVNDILSLKITQFMNFITLSMYRGDLR